MGKLGRSVGACGGLAEEKPELLGFLQFHRTREEDDLTPHLQAVQALSEGSTKEVGVPASDTEGQREVLRGI